ncbi:(2Fe-2S)-binding protein [Sphingomonas japonica]|uniref:Isoquinoline 1-oxidoreductase alpha subunit n=1 Tax=Sphingomonas japonica TaxID=511662 RepID=A0ABX0TW45_9SPHN|nr:(2Fe-2S)-binding protein [Sphingomonas japonica]NIJ22544.1 isoquinoline 1-oxidoreductase alpha subunit [Sphingomonas japonica]
MTRFTVNNQPIEYRLDPQTPLLWALRDASNLTGTKYGCGSGECGACTVDIDGVPRRSCQVPIGTIEGTFVTTIEGLSRDRSHPVQAALIASNVPQCGYCIPGIAMAAAALLRRDRAPSDEAIHETLSNLCRCGIQPRLVDAINRAAALARGDETVSVAAPPGIDRDDAARAVPALIVPDGN